MKLHNIGSLLVIVAVLSGTVSVARAQTSIEVGSSLALAPFGFVNADGAPQGFEVDMLEAIGKKLDFEFTYIKTPRTQIFTALLADKFHLAASAVFITCERLDGRGIEFSVPSYSISQAISVRSEDSENIVSLADLKGLKVGVESKGTAADTLADAYKTKIGFEKSLYTDTTSLFLALEQGRIDAAIQSELVALYAIRDKPNLTVTARIPGTEHMSGLVFRKDDPMRVEFDNALNKLKQEGGLADIYKQWFGKLPDPESITARVVPQITPDTCVTAKPNF